MVDLNIAEILYPSGKVKCRYARYLSEDGTRWIRHGPYRAHHENSQLASEGTYVNGKEDGLWRDYHSNAQLAAEGSYRDGVEVGDWLYWNDDGSACG
ncbi:hypothetical protein V8G57_08125 [Collimonas sp. H4R21]|jgi:antitoxin component YwqK of YwqJK toxin-antitoxin module|uniref:MORN repeat protein n=1 Tax=Collimonas rhizosphaerae TaxID=3126357 RepID=A0ABU9PTL2_9BURK